MFSHDTSSGVFSEPSAALRINPDNPGAAQFSILDQLEDFRSSDGKFRLKICYPELTWGVDGKKCNEWIQTSNPIRESRILGYQPISIAFPRNGQVQTWGGLGRQKQGWAEALMDDTPEEKTWHMAIGATYHEPVGKIPGPIGQENNYGITKVQLFVKKI